MISGQAVRTKPTARPSGGVPDRPDRGAGRRLSVDTLRAALGGGADGFLIKTVSPEALIQSLQLIMLGEKVFPTNLASMLLDMTAPARSTRSAACRGASRKSSRRW